MTRNNGFPTEILEQILAYASIDDLPQLVLVNKHFYTALNPELWRSPMDVKSSYWKSLTGISPLLMCLLQSRNGRLFHPIPLGHNIRKLQLQYNDSVEQIFQLVSLTPNVEELILHTELQKNDLIELVRCFPQLFRLRLIGLENILPESIKFVAYLCRHLRQLTITSIDSLTPLIFFYLKDCPLEQIEILDCKRIITATAATCIASFSKLTHLRLLQNKPGVDEKFMQHFLPSLSGMIPLPFLKVLHIQGGGNRFRLDIALILFIQSHPFLENIRLYSWSLDDDVMMAMAENLPNLMELQIVDCGDITPQAVGKLVRKCAALHTLYIPGCPLEEFFPKLCTMPRHHDYLGPKEISYIRSSSLTPP